MAPPELLEPAVTSLPECGPPVVVFCGGCRAPLGDTLAFGACHVGLRVLALTGASNVTVDSRAGAAPPDALDAGSTAFAVRCARCQRAVGRRYEHTPEALAPLRGLLSFDHAATESYQLGAPEVLATAAAAPAEQPVAVPPGTSGAEPLAERVASLEAQLVQVENMLLLYNERFEQLEAAQAHREKGGSAAKRPRGR